MANEDVCMMGVFSDEFMKKYTKFSSFDQMKRESPFSGQKTADLFNNKRWDKFVKKTTQFDTWKEMLIKSANEQLSEGNI
jgi:hypothetical protein